MVYFQTKKPTLGKIWRAFERKMLLNFITIWNFIRHLVSYKAVWYSLRSFGKFFPFWYVWTKKNLATCPTHILSKLVHNVFRGEW
jgi:hypothetical protein